VPNILRRIKHRMAVLGIGMDTYIETAIIDSWESNPPGFKFRCRDFNGFVRALYYNQNFARATALFDQIPDGIAYREVQKTDSLHVILRRAHNAECNIHIDSISIVEGRDSQGQAIYVEVMAVLFHHLLKDKAHWMK